MPYRKKLKPKTGRSVEVRSYFDLVAAELAAADLGSAGVKAFVVEAASFNPLLVGAAGGHRVMVDEAERERAEEILRRTELTVDVRDEEPEGTVRCPRCELAYCSFDRPSLRGIHPSPLVAAFALPLVVFGQKRWRCDKCNHVWDDAKEGPARITELLPDDPRPVFLLYRPQSGLGAFLGFMIGAGAIAPLAVHFFHLPMPVALLLVAGFLYVGIRVGALFGRFVCSEPACRAPLALDAETCPRCHGDVAGRIDYASEHYSASADVRRELAEVRRADAARAARRLGGGKRVSRPTPDSSP